MPETRVSLVKEEKLKETLASLDKVFSQHVYRWLHLKCYALDLESYFSWPFSIQLSETVSASALYAVDLEVFKEDPMGCCKVTSFSWNNRPDLHPTALVFLGKSYKKEL